MLRKNDDIKMKLKEIGSEGVNCIDVVQLWKLISQQ
jgi:hypothetical protein